MSEHLFLQHSYADTEQQTILSTGSSHSSHKEPADFCSKAAQNNSKQWTLEYLRVPQFHRCFLSFTFLLFIRSQYPNGSPFHMWTILLSPKLHHPIGQMSGIYKRHGPTFKS